MNLIEKSADISKREALRKVMAAIEESGVDKQILLETLARSENVSRVTPELFEKFVQFVDASPKTVATYAYALKQFSTWLSRNHFLCPTRQDILSYRDELKEKCRPSTVQSYMAAVRLFFRWTGEEGIYPNVAEHVKGAKVDRSPKKDYLTAQQVQDVLTAAQQCDGERGARNYAILALAFCCGLRTIELSRADVEDMRPRGEKTVLYVQGKGQEEKSRFLPVPKPAERAVRTYLQARGNASGKSPLFLATANNCKGQRLSTRTISHILKSAMQAAGYDSERLTAHSTRHTAVTLALEAGESLQQVQEFARHTNVSTTEIYAHNLEREYNPCADAIAEQIFR